MPWFSRASTLPACAGAVVLALCHVSSSGLAQTEAGAAAKEASSDQVIITHMPAAKSRIRKFLERILGRSQGSNLETSGSEVVSVPKAQTSQLRKRLEALGAKVIILRDKWNHILRRSKDPIPVAPTQRAAVDKITALPETVNLGMVTMPDPAVVELALKGQGDMKDHFARVVLPLRDDKDITLVRTRPTDKTEGGFTWSGEVEETGERAVLMLWRDGHLSGYFGYKGHVFTVSQVAGEVHAMAEIDPGKLPPDHAPGAKAGQPAKPARMPPEPHVAPFPDADRKALEAKDITIDVMLPYGASAAR